MMGWERGISECVSIKAKAMHDRLKQSKVQATVTKLCVEHPHLNKGLKVLNVGFGLGIVRSQSQIFRGGGC